MDSDERHEPPASSNPSVGRVRDALPSGTGRRAFLGALVATGVGAGAARWLGGRDVGSAGRGEVPIVYGYARADPGDPDTVGPRRKPVPADWLESLAAALRAHRKLPLAELAGFVGSFVVPGSYSDAAASISIRTTAEGLRNQVAGLSIDVDLDVEVVDQLPDPTGESGPLRPSVVADLDERSVPGGVFCGSAETRGSLGPALHDPSSGRRLFATANHLYGGSGVDHRGDPLYLYSGDTRAALGPVERGFAEEDLLLVEPAGERVPANAIRGATPGAVGGQFTKLGLADLQARGEPLEMTGAISGRSSGEIHGIDGVTFYTGEGVRTGQLLWGDESTFTDGDSGSVNYHVDPGDDGQVLVGGVNSARTWWPGANFTWGTAAYAIRERHGLVF